MDFESKRTEYLALIAQALEGYMDEDSAVGQAMAYSILGGGKRVRATLLLAFCDMLGKCDDNAIKAACALEMVHGYSLVHDDLPCMDDDDMRRGKPSTHKSFGEAVALLAGDGLLTKAFAVLAGIDDACKARECVKTLADAAGSRGMILGQELDLTREMNDENALDTTNALKTGRLFAASAKLAQICAGVESPECDIYARDLGLVFQIVDDILDFDTDKGNANYAVLCGPQKAKERAAQLTARAIDSLEKKYGEKAWFLRDFAQELAGRTM